MSFKFTQERASLVDAPNKKKHQDRTGYNYDNPIQKVIKSMVEASLEIELFAGSGREVNKRLLPSAGRVTYNNVRTNISRQDIEAFSAAYPQVAATGSRRIQITEILESGNSITQENQPVQPKVVATENPGAPQEIANENPSSQDTQQVPQESYNIRIIEWQTERVLQIKKFKNYEQYAAWMSRSDILGRVQTVVQSSVEGFKQDIDFPSQKTKDDYIQFFKNPSNTKPDKVKSRILDASFNVKKGLNLSSADFLTWMETEYDNVDFIIKSTEQEYNYDIRYNEPGAMPPEQEEEMTFEPDETMYTPPYPPPPSDPTHEVYAPSIWVLEKPDDSSEILKTLEKGEKITVLDDAVSSDGQMCEIMFEGIPAYVDSSFIKKLPETPEGAIVDFGDPKNFRSSGGIIIWNNQRDRIPYYDPSDAKCKVSIRTEYRNLKHKQTPEESIQDIYRTEIVTGVKAILDEFGKKSGDQEVSFMIDGNPFYHNLARAEDYYLDIKSDSGIKILVTIPHKYLYLVEDKGDEENYEIIREYRTSTFRDKIRKTQRIISSHKKKVEEFEGEIKYYEPEEESLRVSMLPNAIYELFKSNDIKVDESKNSSERFSIGWVGRDIQFVSHLSGDQTETVMKKGMNHFKKKTEISSERTQNILVNLDEIFEKGGKMNWREFVFNYINYNVVSFELKTETKSLEEKEGQIEMSREDRIKEDRYYSNTDRKQKVVQERSEQRDNTKNPKKYKNFKDVMDRMGDELDDVYGNVVNNFDMTKIAMSALECIKTNPFISIDGGFLEVDGVDFDGIFGDIMKLSNGIDDLVGDGVDFISGIFEDPTKIFYFSDLPTDDIIESFIDGIGTALEDMAKALLISLVKSLLGAMGDFCENPESDEMGADDIRDLIEDLRPEIDNVNELIKNGQEDNSSDIEDLITDLASRLSLNEMCRLLAGDPTDDTIDIVLNLVEEKYCKLGLDTPAKVIEFFKSIGKISAYPLCKQGETPSEHIGPPLNPWETLCPPEEKQEALRTKGLSDKQVEEQIEKERKRLNDLANEILDAFKNGPLSGKQEAPPTFCTKDENGNIKPGMASFMDPTFSEEIRTTVETLVKPVYESFQKEGREYSSSLIGFKEVDGEVQEAVNIPGMGDVFITKKAKVRKRVVLPEIAASYKSFKSFNSTPFKELERFDISENSTLNDCFHIPMGNVGQINETLEELNKMKKNLEETPTSLAFGVNIKSAMESRLNTVMERMDDAKKALDEKVILRIKDPCQNTRRSNIIANIAGQLQNVDTRLNISTNQNNPNPEYKEECEKINTFANLPIIHFMDNRAGSQSSNESQIINPGIDLTRMQRDSARNLPDLSSDAPCESERYLSYELETTEKTYSYQKKIDDFSYGTVMQTPYTADEGKLRRHSFFHQLVKTQLTAYDDQKSLDTDLSKTILIHVYNKLNKQILTKMRQTILSNSYTKEVSIGEQLPSDESAQYMIELVDLGPLMTPECDPHLLRLKDLSDEVLSNFQEDYCVTLGGNGQKTPIQKSVMRACVRASLRHYLIDFYARGMFTAAAFRDDSSSRIIFEFITDKIISEMMKYSLSYSKDFTRELVLLDSESEEENIDEATVRETFTKMLDKEYNIIKKGFQESLLIDREKLPSIKEVVGDKYANKSITINSKGLLVNIEEADLTDEMVEEFYGEYALDKEFDPFDIDNTNLQQTGRERIEDKERSFKFALSEPVFKTCVQYYEETTGKYFSRQEALDYLYNDIIFSGEDTKFKNFKMITSLVCLTADFASPYYASLQDFPNFKSEPPKEGEELETSRTNGLWCHVKRPSGFSNETGFSAYVYPIIQRTDNVMIPSEEAEDVARRILFIEDNPKTKLLFDYSIPIQDYYSAFLVHEIESNSRISEIVLAFGETRDELHNLFYSVLPRGDYWNRNPKALEGLPPNLAAIFSINFNPFNTPCIDLRWNFGLPGIKWGNPFKGINFSFAWKAALNMSLMIFKEWVRKNDPNIILAQKLSFLLSLACINVSERDISAVLGIPYLTNPYMMNAYNTAYNFLGLGDFDLKLSLGSDDKDKIVKLFDENGFSLPDYCKIEEEAQGGVPVGTNNSESTNQLIRDLMPSLVTGDLTVSDIHELRMKVTAMNALRTRASELNRLIEDFRFNQEDGRWAGIYRDPTSKQKLDIYDKITTLLPQNSGHGFGGVRFPYRPEFRDDYLESRAFYDYIVVPAELRYEAYNTWSQTKVNNGGKRAEFVFVFGPDTPNNIIPAEEFEYNGLFDSSTGIITFQPWDENKLHEATQAGLRFDDYVSYIEAGNSDKELVYWNWNDGTNGQRWGLSGEYRLLPYYKDQLDEMILERKEIGPQIRRLEEELYGEFYNNA